MNEQKQLNLMTAQLMVSQSAVWHLGSTLRDCMNRLDTIRETNPELAVDIEIQRAKSVLEKHAPEILKYCPPPEWER